MGAGLTSLWGGDIFLSVLGGRWWSSSFPNLPEKYNYELHEQKTNMSNNKIHINQQWFIIWEKKDKKTRQVHQKCRKNKLQWQLWLQGPYTVQPNHNCSTAWTSIKGPACIQWVVVSIRKRPQPPIHFVLHTSRTISCHFIPPVHRQPSKTVDVAVSYSILAAYLQPHITGMSLKLFAKVFPG